MASTEAQARPIEGSSPQKVVPWREARRCMTAAGMRVEQSGARSDGHWKKDKGGTVRRAAAAGAGCAGGRRARGGERRTPGASTSYDGAPLAARRSEPRSAGRPSSPSSRRAAASSAPAPGPEPGAPEPGTEPGLAAAAGGGGGADSHASGGAADGSIPAFVATGLAACTYQLRASRAGAGRGTLRPTRLLFVF